MTNPDREELLGYADSLNQQADWIEAALAPETPDSQRIGIEDIDIDELRGASDLLRRLASSDGGVRELEWRDHSFKESVLHIAPTAFEDYRITLDLDANWPWVLRPFIAGQSNYQTLEAAKAAAQTDYEARIKAALVEVPAVKGEPEPVAWPSDGSCVRCGAVPRTASGLCNTCLDEDAERYENAPPADTGMREALEEIEVYAKVYGVLLDSDRERLRVAAETLRKALTALGATTKSDVEALAATAAGRPGTVTSEPEPSPSDPSSTRSDVTVESLADWLNKRGSLIAKAALSNPGRHSTIDLARALLDQFEIRRK